MQTCDVAIIAGSGKLPVLLFKELQALGRSVLVFDISGQPSPDLYKGSSLYYLLSPIEIKKALAIMLQAKVKELVMIGGISHQGLLTLRPWHLNLEALKIWWSLKDTRTDTVLAALADYFTSHGVPVISSLKYLARYIVGHFFKNRDLSNDKDILLGIVAAKLLGHIDVGQSVVVCRGSVVALEAVEGTDRCLDRAIELGSSGAVLVKMSKPSQDLRFDVPTIGENTFARLKKGNFRALVLEANSCFCTDMKGLKELHSLGIDLVIADDKLIQKAFELFGPKGSLQ